MGEKIPRYDADGNLEGYDEIDGDRIIHYDDSAFPKKIGHSEIGEYKTKHYNNSAFPSQIGSSGRGLDALLRKDASDGGNSSEEPEKTVEEHSERSDGSASDYSSPSDYSFSNSSDSNSSGSGGTFPFGLIAGGLFALFAMATCIGSIGHSNNRNQSYGTSNAQYIQTTPKKVSKPKNFKLNLQINYKTLKELDSDGDESASLEELIAYCPQIERQINRGAMLEMNVDLEDDSKKKSCGDLIYGGIAEPSNQLDRRITAVQLVDHNLLGQVSRVYDITEEDYPELFRNMDCNGKGYTTLRDYKKIEDEFASAVSRDRVGVKHGVRSFYPSCDK